MAQGCRDIFAVRRNEKKDISYGIEQFFRAERRNMVICTHASSSILLLRFRTVVFQGLEPRLRQHRRRGCETANSPKLTDRRESFLCPGCVTEKTSLFFFRLLLSVRASFEDKFQKKDVRMKKKRRVEQPLDS